MHPAARQQFLAHYTAIRHAEGRGSADPEYYRALPDRDLNGTAPDHWRIRVRSSQHFVQTVLRQLEAAAGRPLDLLDLGAGNGWMSHRLALRGHRAVAVDVFEDRQDGLGALMRYDHSVSAIAAD